MHFPKDIFYESLSGPRLIRLLLKPSGGRGIMGRACQAVGDDVGGC